MAAACAAVGETTVGSLRMTVAADIVAAGTAAAAAATERVADKHQVFAVEAVELHGKIVAACSRGQVLLRWDQGATQYHQIRHCCH